MCLCMQYFVFRAVNRQRLTFSLLILRGNIYNLEIRSTRKAIELFVFLCYNDFNIKYTSGEN